MADALNSDMQFAAAVVGQSDGISVLVVGDEAFANRIDKILRLESVEVSIQTVPDYLMAMGQVAVDPPSVLIGHIDGLDEPIETTAQALRSLAPQVRMLLLTEAQRQGDAERAVKSGFDVYLREPIDSDALSLAVEVGAIDAGSINESPWLMTSTPPSAKAGSQTSEVTRDPSGVRDAGPTLDGVEDIDLLDQMLPGNGRLLNTAVRSISKRIGVADMGWLDPSQAAPPGRAWVWVERDGQRLGRLHAPNSVPEDRLRPWAAWLGRWLTLQSYVDHLRHIAMHDDLTGLWNRRYFNRFFKIILERAARQRFNVTLMLFDIDDFKSYNDRYGHMAGDDILRETAKLMQSLVREHDVVARIGGDEFAVIFWDPAGPRRPNSAQPNDPIEVAQRFRQAICTHRFPKLGHEAPGTLTISGGLAGCPWDGRTPDQLMEIADKMAMQSKRQGKNALAIGPGAQRNCQSTSP